jgi:tetratricopeptide (TPR) repeat protein
MGEDPRNPRNPRNPRPEPGRSERGRSERGRSERGQRGGAERGQRGGRPERSGRREGTARDVDQTRYDGPELPAEITGTELDRNVAAQLRGLPEKLAARVARHLVAAGTLIDTDPETAYAHALAARARASRVAVVREATGETAYAAGHYAEALAELRAAKRMNGNTDYLPVMADCERALGRPERALELAKSPAVAKLTGAQRIEMTIVEAGARHDLGETTSALRTLENAPLHSASREEWVVRLRYAYADLLTHAGRTHDAIEWFHRTAAIDAHHTTDATQRLTHLEQDTQ